jgi:hypothetical protein
MMCRHIMFERQEIAMTALLLAIVSGIVLLAVVARTLIVTIRDDRGRIPHRTAYDTRRPFP